MSPVRRFAAGAVVAAVAVLATAAPASAHDALIQSNPGVDERLSAPPESISLTFSGQLLTLGDSMSGAVIVVSDADGRDWAAGEAVVDGNAVSVGVEPGMPESGYQVRWQVISEDGHPISGVIPFTIGDAAPLAPSARPSADALSPEEPSAADVDLPRIVIVGLVGAALAAAVLAVILFLRRPRAAAVAPLGDDTQNTTERSS